MAERNWHIVFSPLPGVVPDEVRVRRLLKLGLRSCGLRAMDVREVKVEPKQGTNRHDIDISIETAAIR